MTQLSYQIKKEAARWYPLIEHPMQLAAVDAVDNGIRFPLLPCGRRSGKTERFKRFIVKRAMTYPGLYFVGAPTYGQVQKIYWHDLKLLSCASMFGHRISETNLTITFANGSIIYLIGFDKPARFEGIPWDGGGIDEIADIKPDAWNLNIRPALDTFNPTRPDYKPWCWLLGVPDGLNHYYDMCQAAESGADPDSKVFHWKSADILPPETIEAAKRVMGRKQFLQEYEASFETSTGRIYEDYGKDNLTTETIQPHERLYWYHDFNFTPLSSGVGVRRENNIFLLDEIVLVSAVAEQSALEFCEKFKTHKNKHVIIFGDPSGRAGEKHGHDSDYTNIERVLRENGWTYQRKVNNSTKSIKDGQNAVRAKIANAAGDRSLFVNCAKAPYTHKSLATGQLKKGSTFMEEDSEYQHIGTAIRYMCEVEFPIITPIRNTQPLR